MNAYTAAVLIVIALVAGGVVLIIHGHLWIGGFLCFAATGISVERNKS